MSKPKICQILNVEPGEVWSVVVYGQTLNLCIDNQGWLIRKYKSGQEKIVPNNWIVDLVNHPEKIIHKSSWTAQDIADADAISRIFGNLQLVKRVGNHLEIGGNGTEKPIIVSGNLLPSLKDGQSVVLGCLTGAF